MNKSVACKFSWSGFVCCCFFILVHVLYKLRTEESQVTAAAYSVVPVKTIKLCTNDRDQICLWHPSQTDSLSL